MEKLLGGLLVVLAIAGVVAFQGWLVMLAAGVLHGYWPSVPAFTFWEATIVSAVIALFLGVVRGDK